MCKYKIGHLRISVIVSLMPVSKEAAENQTLKNNEEFRRLQNPYPIYEIKREFHFPFSILLFGFGGCLILLAVIPLLLNTICHQHVKDTTQFDNISVSGSMVNGSLVSYPMGDENGGPKRKLRKGKMGVDNSMLSISTDPDPYLQGPPMYPSIRSASTEHLYHHNRFVRDPSLGRQHQDPENPLQAFALDEAMHYNEREVSSRRGSRSSRNSVPRNIGPQEVTF